MVIDKISNTALESLLGITFGEHIEHYSIVASKGLSYELIDNIELNYNETKVKESFTPFSTFASKNKLNDGNHSGNEVLDNVKTASIFGFLKNIMKGKEKLLKISDDIDSCITDELVKSQKILDNSELTNPAIILLIKGIKNLENPESLPGLTARNIQEIAGIQIGMAINSMMDKTPTLFTYNMNTRDDFNHILYNLNRSKFISSCCKAAREKEKNIIELTLASKKDSQFDALLKADNSIDYSSSFKDLDDIKRAKKITSIKKEARTIYREKYSN